MKFRMTPIFIVLSILFMVGCPATDKKPLKFPESFRSYIGKTDCPACDLLTELAGSNTQSEVYIFGIVSPQAGSTFFVNIDRERETIKIHPVKDRSESIILFDPHGQASHGHETGSKYIQARCSDGINRFELAAGFVYDEGASGEDFREFFLAGKCAMSGESRLLYRYPAQ